ncbi:HNH endonuclease [Undibacterium sp. FT147W]|uniref:HNH endonuclease n=1 Tax=Undibacterium rivi TaxID=2828729 RepID=A0ABS5H3L9_9BURK|nr:HNH endonuclease [Undibacterium rivi]MBR7793336.1 HNH endonuclease [Undibacterium rivi]
MSAAAPLQQATANSHAETRTNPRQLRQNAAVAGREKQSNFVDSRPQTAIQRRLRETAADSPQAAQLQALQRIAAASERAVQLKRMSAAASTAALQRVEDEELLQGKFATIQRVEEEEPLQGKFKTAQRVEEDEPLQNKLITAQRVEDEEPLQGKFVPVQRVEEDELLQGKFDTVQRQEQATAKPNNTGLPNQLKSGIESLSGMSMDHVKVRYNSSQPAQLNALAYAQGSDIHVAPGQEQHLPHEAWHVVQQAQGRVKPTMQMKDGVAVNDDAGLETEADVMGAKALKLLQTKAQLKDTSPSTSIRKSDVAVQRVWKRGSEIINSKTVDGNPISYLELILGNDNPFNHYVNAYKTNEDSDFSELYDRLSNTLIEERQYELDTIINNATEWIKSKFPQDNNDEIVDDNDHPEGSGEMESLEPEDIDTTYWKSSDAKWLASFFCDLNVVKEQVSLAEKTGFSVAQNVFNQWTNSGPLTRNQIASLIAQEKIRQSGQISDKGIKQFARGAGISGPKTYTSNTVGQYKNVAYTRDGNGYFDFTKPTQKTQWATPISGGIIDMELGCKKTGYGLMKDNKTKVKLQTATRAQHFSIANRIAGYSGSGSPDNYTWHHLKQKYKMILVDRKVHQQHGHNGGIFLWK